MEDQFVLVLTRLEISLRTEILEYQYQEINKIEENKIFEQTKKEMNQTLKKKVEGENIKSS